MTVTVSALRCGIIEVEADVFVSGLEGTIHMPTWAFLIRHPAGTVLFDTAVDPLVRSDPARALGAELAALLTFHVAPDDDVVSQLANHDISPDEVTVVVNSHLHFDHAGGNAAFSSARCVMQGAEWEDAVERGGRDGFVDPAALGEVERIDGELDLFGDGTVRMTPTPGHTRGHQSLLVATSSGPVVLTGDACFLRRALDEDRLPRFGWDLGEQHRSWARLRALEAAGATLVFGHDDNIPDIVMTRS